MTKVRATEWNEGVKTRYIQESDGKLTINNQQNINPLLERNKKLYTANSGYTPSKDFKRIASIPPIMLEIWTKEHNGSRNWFALPKETQNKILKTKLNSSEFRYFRTAEGKL
jgi:hypothetical protein